VIISLSGDARDVGKRVGKLNAEDIRKHVREMTDGWRKRGLTDDQMRQRSEPFRRFADKFAPHWLDELHAIAAAADVDPDQYTAFLAGKYRDLFFVEECTSFLAVGSATADGATLFHKNRDNVARAQCLLRKKIAHSSAPFGFYGVGDTSDIGLMMMVNERGVAGSADVGGPAEDRPKGKGVMNPYILRLVAERAERCEDALEIVQQCLRDGWYAGGSTVGTNWLFADRFGKGLRVAQNSYQEEHWFFEDTVALLAREETEGARLITDKKGRITLADMNAAATHPSICFATSVSALSVRIDPDKPAELSSVWTALPAWSPYVPLLPAVDGVPKSIADGAFFEKAYELRRLDEQPDNPNTLMLPDAFVRARDKCQREIYAESAELERRIRAASDDGKLDEARQVATERMLSLCDKAMAFVQAGAGA